MTVFWTVSASENAINETAMLELVGMDTLFCKWKFHSRCEKFSWMKFDNVGRLLDAKMKKECLYDWKWCFSKICHNAKNLAKKFGCLLIQVDESFQKSIWSLKLVRLNVLDDIVDKYIYCSYSLVHNLKSGYVPLVVAQCAEEACENPSATMMMLAQGLGWCGPWPGFC